MEKNWLDSLNVGDSIVRAYGFGMKDYQIKKVDRLTPSQIVVGGEKFNRKNGSKIPRDRFSRVTLQELTPTLSAKIFREKAIRDLRSTVWERVSDEALIQMLELSKDAR